MKKDSVFKKFIFMLVIGLCAFAFAAGVRTAYVGTSAQLTDKKADKVYENDITKYVYDKISGLLLLTFVV